MKIRAFVGCMLAMTPVQAEVSSMRVRLSWGHQSREAAARYIRLEAPQPFPSVAGWSLEAGDAVQGSVIRGRSGAGDVDGVDVQFVYENTPPRRIENLHIIWSDLIAASDAATAQRLLEDPALLENPRKFTVYTNEEGTRGFSVAAEQLKAHRTMWIPSLDIFISTGDSPAAFEPIRSQEKRVLDRVAEEPEASYEQYKSLWEDMGSPLWAYPEQRGPGHIVGLAWDSSIAKFGVDRGAGVWNDYGNPDQFRQWFGFADIAQGLAGHWKEQRLDNGLPLVTTVVERDRVHYEVEQFAFPLRGVPSERRGDIPMVLMQRVRATDLSGAARKLPVSIVHRRRFAPYVNSRLDVKPSGDAWLLREAGYGRALLSVEQAGEVRWAGVHDYQKEQKRTDLFVTLDLPANGTREFVVKLPSPMVAADDVAALVKLDYAASREATVRFWSDYVARGARFEVPEKAVNDLFRASLWHALRLPRRHSSTRIDLPYSNFAYSQTGTPWPVNQAVYVDYMIYDLRRYHAISTEELLAQYRNNQEHDGHVNGYANWVVYTPSMIYVTAKNYLLSGNREHFEQLLPFALKAMDWCIAATRERGLGYGPLNDLTGEGWWAFNQAYLYAGLDAFAAALERYGHPRAKESRAAADRMRKSIDAAFGTASAHSTLVRLRDGSWTPYVPVEAKTPRRLFDQWYPTDIDTGAVHLLRLQALDPRGPLADALLHDHEDNLFYKGLGIANEPVYNQHATAYLWRDMPKAVIRSFYSLMASGFSHSTLEPVEHRWTHGQYFGPPSTDGAWFELYRNMLLHERDRDTLAIGMAVPRAWLRDPQGIRVEHAPTYFGPVNFTMRRTGDRITADIELGGGTPPRTLLIRFRHPEEKRITAVTADGMASKDFDPANEWVRIPAPRAGRHQIVASY